MLDDQSNDDIVLVYDKQGPDCDNYGQRLGSKQSVGPLRIIDARQSGDVLAEITAQGYGLLCYGADAIHALALISSRGGIFNRLNDWIFRSLAISRLVYP